MTDVHVCSLVSKEIPVSGSVIQHCADCDASIWLAPTGQEMIAHSNATLVCIPCGIERMKADPSPEVALPTEAQLAEIKQEMERR
jgi:hypothetical protein